MFLCVYVMCMGTHRSQKRVPDPLKLLRWVGVSHLCKCWEPNLCPLEETQVLSTIATPLQSL